MLTKTQMQQIQDLKLMGYTKTDIIRYYEARGEKPPSRPTISKYYDMDVVPDDPGAKLAKLKTFDSEPFRSTILRILETNSGKSFCMSSVYDTPIGRQIAPPPWGLVLYFSSSFMRFS